MLFWLQDIVEQWRVFPTITPPLPVVSIGGLTVGGSGKTPVTQALAHRCIEQGIVPGIILRGYRRRSRGTLVVSRGEGPEVPWELSGDEAWLHAWKLPQAIVVVDRHREVASMAAWHLGARIVLADDCFQYRRLRRQLELVLVDRRTLRRPYVIPFGPLREPLSALRRAHAVLLNGIEPEELPLFARHLPWIRVHFQHSGAMVWTPTGLQPLLSIPSEPVAAFAGIALPERFRQDLQKSGWQLGLWRPFRDHYPYSRRVIRAFLTQCWDRGLRWAITTEKDIVRLQPLLPEFLSAGVTLVSVSLVAEFGEGSDSLWTLVDRLLQ
ncbi:MAG: tetraacyldisaccharide 4'-kinase [Candidatus Kapabacteria bacterium]|nr:tetraacyldisaccharide 4'-kinase [Candidatus Kapabacteria bacterium]MDW8225196.1 tetraacyldisaccharide 4'-kinase [Bacteroidota bacterium]